ncbi:hypothetical protein [Actinoplanes sp. HUAS TT8]|uniref:hypothetical protein n=1 Tax=Actinoplanes sp. HUAS TT8 TaxID=3447453 RepID=UPI003F524322
MRRIITTFGLVTALVVAMSAPAAAVGATTVDQLEAALPAAVDLPTGYTVSGGPYTDETWLFGYGRPCDNDEDKSGRKATAVTQEYRSGSDRHLEMVVAAPGSYWAREFVRHWADRPIRCPHNTNAAYGSVEMDYTSMPLPAVGDASAGVITVLTGQMRLDGLPGPANPARELSAAVAVGDLLGFYELHGVTPADGAGFMEFVARSAAKLIRIKGQLDASNGPARERPPSGTR